MLVATVKYAPRTSTQAVKWAKAQVGKAIYSGMCQAFTVTAFGTGAIGDYDGDRDADAVDGWKAAKVKVHAKDIKNYNKIPAGVALYWKGGSRGYGHAAVSIGNGMMVTTDRSNGRVGIAPIKGWWSRTHQFLGYVTVEGNGHTLTDPPKVKPLRLLTWNVSLKVNRSDTPWRRKRIAQRVKRWKPNVMFVQECPTSGDGKELIRLLKKKAGLTQRVGSHARYILFRKNAKIHGWKSIKVNGKRATLACATVGNAKYVFVNCHPVSGSNKSAERTVWARKVIRKAETFAAKHGVKPTEIIFGGDFNGPEFRRVASQEFSYGRLWGQARSRTKWKRTFNGWGKKRKTDPGGVFDYFVGNKAIFSRVTKAKTWWTYKASDHSPVFVRIAPE